MLTRAAVLERFGLRDRSVFAMEPHCDDQDIWRVKVSHKGDPVILMDYGDATSLAVMIRSVDRHLADQIDACVEKARRYSKNSD